MSNKEPNKQVIKKDSSKNNKISKPIKPQTNQTVTNNSNNSLKSNKPPFIKEANTHIAVAKAFTM